MGNLPGHTTFVQDLINSVQSLVESCIMRVLNIDGGLWANRFILSDGEGFICKAIRDIFSIRSKQISESKHVASNTHQHLTLTSLADFGELMGWVIDVVDTSVIVTTNIEQPSFAYLTSLFGGAPPSSSCELKRQDNGGYKLNINAEWLKYYEYRTIPSQQPLVYGELDILKRNLLSSVKSCVKEILSGDDTAIVKRFILSDGAGLFCKAIGHAFDDRKRILSSNRHFNASRPDEPDPTVFTIFTKAAFVWAHLVDSYHHGWDIRYNGNTVYSFNTTQDSQESSPPRFNHLTKVFGDEPSSMMWTPMATSFCLHEEWVEYYANIFGFYGYNCDHISLKSSSGCTVGSHSKRGTYTTLSKCEAACTIIPKSVIETMLMPMLTPRDRKSIRATSKYLLEVGSYVPDKEDAKQITVMFNAIVGHRSYTEFIIEWAMSKYSGDEQMLKNDIMKSIVLANDYKKFHNLELKKKDGR